LFEAPLSNDVGLATQALAHYSLFAMAIAHLGTKWHWENILPLIASQMTSTKYSGTFTPVILKIKF